MVNTKKYKRKAGSSSSNSSRKAVSKIQSVVRGRKTRKSFKSNTVRKAIKSNTNRFYNLPMELQDVVKDFGKKEKQNNTNSLFEILKTKYTKSNEKKAITYLNNPIYINQKYSTKFIENNTLLHLAIKNKYTEVAKILLKKEININNTNDLGLTPLHYAVIYKNITILKHLIKNKANLEAKDIQDNTPLVFAIDNELVGTGWGDAFTEQDVEIVRILVEAGADVEAEYNGPNWRASNLLSLAVAESMRWNFNAPHLYNNTKQIQIVEILLKNNADPNKEFDFDHIPVLHSAAQWGDKKLVKLLIQYHANIHAKTEDGDTPLSFAVGAMYDPPNQGDDDYKGLLNVIKLLLSYNLRVEDMRYTIRRAQEILSDFQDDELAEDNCKAIKRVIKMIKKKINTTTAGKKTRKIRKIRKIRKK